MDEVRTRSERIRAIGTALWAPGEMKPGDWRFNTHHGLYQFALRPTGRFLVLPTEIVEWHNSAFSRWCAEVMQARGLVAGSLAGRPHDRRRVVHAHPE